MNNESFGWVMAKCSETAYLDGKKAKPLYKGLGFSRHKYFDKNGAQAHAAYDKEWFVLAIRGTEVKSWSDIKADLNVKSITAKYSHGKVHEGFEKEVDKLWVDIRDYVLKQCKDRKLIITGHSLGVAWEICEYFVEGTEEVYGPKKKWAYNTGADLLVEIGAAWWMVA
jgi:hypothetical protein